MTEDVEKFEGPMGLLENLELVEEAGRLHTKGYSKKDISELMDTTPYMVGQYIEEYKAIIRRKAEDDPYFLERVQENTIETLAGLDEVLKEAWESVNIATDNGMINQRIQALKLVLDAQGKRAQLLQLMGGQQSADADYIARMQRAENVNQLLSRVLRDIVSDCERCRERSRVLLQEAFSMMNDSVIDVSSEVVDGQ